MHCNNTDDVIILKKSLRRERWWDIKSITRSKTSSWEYISLQGLWWMMWWVCDTHCDDVTHMALCDANYWKVREYRRSGVLVTLAAFPANHNMGLPPNLLSSTFHTPVSWTINISILRRNVPSASFETPESIWISGRFESLLYGPS